jgi:hypothetical protein
VILVVVERGEVMIQAWHGSSSRAVLEKRRRNMVVIVVCDENSDCRLYYIPMTYGIQSFVTSQNFRNKREQERCVMSVLQIR